MKLLADFSLNELSVFCAETGLSNYRAKQLFAWAQRCASFEEMTDLPKELRQRLSSEFLSPPLDIFEEYLSSDGSVKLLYKLSDGDYIEGVFMPHGYGNSLCVSTQVGCRMGCAFCASGTGGLVRNLSAGEMVGQVVLSDRKFASQNGIKSIVLMGSGEPLDNYENVTKFLSLINDSGGFGLGQRSISLSTCGIAPNIERLADDGFSVTLSVSLHAADDSKRESIMPSAKKNPLTRLMSAVKYYFNKTGRRIIYEYALISGVNMNGEDVKNLKKICAVCPSHVNLIMLNKVEGKQLNGCSRTEAARFMKVLEDSGISVTLRRSMGGDVAGACGQLRNRFVRKGTDM